MRQYVHIKHITIRNLNHLQNEHYVTRFKGINVRNTIYSIILLKRNQFYKLLILRQI